MTIERTEVVWLEARVGYSIAEVAEMSGLPTALIDELIACGALPCTESPDQSSDRVAADSIALARAAGRLREHFELDEQGLAVAVSLLKRVRVLEARLTELRAQSMMLVD
jgi:chaperone modulatory protein CbpM